MSDPEWAFPGPAQFQYMHVSPQFFGITSKDPYVLGKEYIRCLVLWNMGVEAGKKIDVQPPSEEPEPDTSLAERNLKAQPMEPQAAEEEIKTRLGATVVESDAPWNNKDMAPTAPKPWESGGSESPPRKASGSAGVPKKTKTSTIDIDI